MGALTKHRWSRCTNLPNQTWTSRRRMATSEGALPLIFSLLGAFGTYLLGGGYLPYKKNYKVLVFYM